MTAAREAAAMGGGMARIDAGESVVVDWNALPLAAARQHRALALRRPGDDRLLLAMADPWDDAQARRLVGWIGHWPLLAVASTEVLEQHLGGEEQGPVLARMPAKAAREHDASGHTIVDFVDLAIERALQSNASDIHFESDRTGMALKLRQDGVMVAVERLDGVAGAEQVVSRIKVLAMLDITERRIPQDGRFRWERAGRSLDLRVSVMPCIHGEDAVLRLLDRGQLRDAADAVSLDLLGFAPAEAQRLRGLARLPHGMLLVTGPTGSGKTTTVYAALSEVNTGLEKIITIEDPVEYELPGVLQIPVNERKGLTFAKGLRSILRHDPDRILVGEIRDAETAEIAVQSALTGHQVFTTVHANSVYDVMGRFRHFGIDLFGFMSSLNGVVVQRLVRRLCSHCKSLSPGPALPAPAGCARCQHTGYQGRTVIAEVHGIDDTLRDLVTRNAPLSELRRHVEEAQPGGLQRQAARLVSEGVTSLDEVRRVIGWA